MRGCLGEKIGEGAMADVHAWAPGQVVKLFKVGVARRLVRWEARMTRAVFAAGGPAPQVLDEVTLEERFGIVLPRLDGPTLRQLSQTGAMAPAEVGAILAAVALAVHETPPPPEVVPLRNYVEGSLQLDRGRLTPSIAAGILNLIDLLSPGEGLCHCDIHTGNVIMTPQGPRLIDWLSAVRAPAALDLACSQVIFCDIVAEIVDDPARPRAISAAMQAEYARLAGMSPASLAAAVEPYLSIARVLLLLGGDAAGQRRQLVQRVETSLRSEA